MNRAQFMQKLGALLGDIEINERTDALKYYADYFDDAGVENESQVIEELGSPEKVAKIIKAELSAKGKESGEFTESGYKNPAYEENTTAVASTPTNKTDNTQQAGAQNSQSAAPKNDAGRIILIVLLCIFTIPVGIPVITAVFSLVFGIFSTIIGLIIGLGATAIALFIAAIVVLIIGFINIFAVPFASFILIAVSLLMAALGVLLMILTVLVCGKLLPAFIRGVVYLCSAPFKRKEAMA
ncbi:MAG TPA: DUF1700 domain-containing protein [Lachnospiraceae bacterium]|nr:DUF1700 domain-containing protein [Lachnospiraceae bacterium]